MAISIYFTYDNRTYQQTKKVQVITAANQNKDEYYTEPTRTLTKTAWLPLGAGDLVTIDLQLIGWQSVTIFED